MVVSIANILLRNTPTAQVGDSLAHVYQLMDQQHFTAMVIMRDGKPLGILSKHDITLIQQQNINLQTSILASHIASKSIAQLELTMPLQKAFDFLFDHQLRQLAIINQHGELEGLLTLESIIENISGKTFQHNSKHNPEQLEYQLFKKAINTIQESLFITDPNGIIQYTNQSFTRIMGYSPQEVLGKTP
ncbi:MAG: CBS domain-containing protein, partial [Mariprofundaceae bacterium]|nr:CBS domain-containing protein [Mariprofundaceae bacterium]